MVRESCHGLESYALISTNPAGDIWLPDSLMFLLIVYLVKKSKATGFTGILLKTIMEDATLYFLIIFSSHLVFEFTLLFGRVSATAPPLSGLQTMTSNTCL